MLLLEVEIDCIYLGVPLRIELQLSPPVYAHAYVYLYSTGFLFITPAYSRAIHVNPSSTFLSLLVSSFLSPPSFSRGKTKGSKGARQVQLLRSRAGKSAGQQQQQAWHGGGEKKDSLLGMLIKCTPQEEEKRLQRMNRFGLACNSAPAAGGGTSSSTSDLSNNKVRKIERNKLSSIQVILALSVCMHASEKQTSGYVER